MQGNQAQGGAVGQAAGAVEIVKPCRVGQAVVIETRGDGIKCGPPHPALTIWGGGKGDAKRIGRLDQQVANGVGGGQRGWGVEG